MVKDYYRLDEAAHRLECKVTDFLHLAATAKIVLSVFVDEEYIHSVFNADDEADYSRHYAPWKGEGVPDFCKPVYPNLFDLSQQSAVELKNTGTATVSKLSCKEGSIITVLHKPAWFYGGFPKQDIKITAKELEKAKGLIQSEVPEAEQPKEVDAREDSAKHTSVVDYCCDLLLWDFENFLTSKAGSEKAGEGEPRLWSNLATNLRTIHAEQSGIFAFMAFEDFLSERIKSYPLGSHDIGRMVAEDALSALNKRPELTYKYVLPQALQLAAMARKPELFLRDILLLFGIGTPNKFHLTDYYEIDRHGIHAKPLSEDEERKLQDSGGLYCTWDEIIRLHRLDFPCTPSQLIDWCNRYDPFGMEWEALLPEVFVKVVKASMVDNEDKSCYTKESPKTAPSMANGAETNKSLASAEKNCKAWLIGLMGGDSTPDKTKAVYQKEAQEKYKKLSARAFVRAWGGAIADTGNAKWSNPGRKPIQS